MDSMRSWQYHRNLPCFGALRPIPKGKQEKCHMGRVQSAFGGISDGQPILVCVSLSLYIYISLSLSLSDPKKAQRLACHPGHAKPGELGAQKLVGAMLGLIFLAWNLIQILRWERSIIAYATVWLFFCRNKML